MLSYQETQNALHTRLIEFSMQEYMFVLQVVLGEDIRIAYANVFDQQEFRRNVPSDDEEEYLSKFTRQAQDLLEQQNCQHLKDYLNDEYQRDIQEKAYHLEDVRFTGQDVQRILNNLLRDRTQVLSESSIKDITALLKMMYESGSIDSGADQFARHFITVPKNYDTMCPRCNTEGYAVEGLDFKCRKCGLVAKWDEEERRFYPQLGSL